MYAHVITERGYDNAYMQEGARMNGGGVRGVSGGVFRRLYVLLGAEGTLEKTFAFELTNMSLG